MRVLCITCPSIEMRPFPQDKLAFQCPLCKRAVMVMEGE